MTISINRIRAIVKENGNQISTTAATLLLLWVEQQVREKLEEVTKLHREWNQRRQQQGIKVKKRISDDVIREILKPKK